MGHEGECFEEKSPEGGSQFKSAGLGEANLMPTLLRSIFHEAVCLGIITSSTSPITLRIASAEPISVAYKSRKDTYPRAPQWIVFQRTPTCHL